jgi:hypothetical protein
MACDFRNGFYDDVTIFNVFMWTVGFNADGNTNPKEGATKNHCWRCESSIIYNFFMYQSLLLNGADITITLKLKKGHGKFGLLL